MRAKTFILASILFLSGTALALQDSQEAADSLSVSGSTTESTVSVIRVDGTIGPTVTQYIRRGIRESIENGDEVLIIEMDTPGGLLDSTQEIVQEMLGTDHPLVVYVSPRGANAGSAGTFITLAAHVAVMAPATNIGAASPISMTGGQMDSVAQKKIFNYSESYIESIAQERGRNTDWAKSAVRDGASITAEEALALNVIDFIAEDLNDVLNQLDGMVVGERILYTENAAISRIDRTLAEEFFSFLLRPEVMLILTMVAIYGIIGEVSNPGAIVPGVSGVIALILLLYGVAAMPINLAGFLLIGLAIILFVAEAFTPTFGILLSGGAVSFFLGSLMLFQDLPDEMQISFYWLIPATLLTVAFFAWIILYGIKSLFNPPRTGLEASIGKIAEVSDTIRPHHTGRVFFDGEYWTAESDYEIKEGEYCKIEEFKGLKVIVKPTGAEPESKKGETERA